MQTFFETVVTMKSLAGLVFAGQVILYAVFGSFFGRSSMPFLFIWQAAALAVITSLLHYVAFADRVIRKMNYSLRLALFSVPLFGVLTVFAIVFQWFPFNAVAWTIFTIAYLLVFGLLTIGCELYARITGKKLNESLLAYHRKA